MAQLVVLSGPQEGQVFDLEDRCVIGRQQDCDIRLKDDAVSRHHAVVSAEEDGYYIEDLGSSNGTFLNGRAITKVKLEEGDTIKMSHSVLAFRAQARQHETQVTVVEDTERRDSTIVRTHDVVASLLRDTTTIESIDQLQELHEKLITVTRFSREVRSTLDLGALLRKVLGLLFEIFAQAERGFVMLRDEGGNMRPVASKNVLADEEIRVSGSVLNVAIKEKKAILSNNPIEDDRFDSGESIVTGGMRSLMVSPLMAEEGVIGVLHVDTTRPAAPFSTDDLALFSGLADQAAVAVANAYMHERLLRRQRFEQELSIAQTVQRSFLPARLPESPLVELAFHYALARQVGGDFYDMAQLADGRLAFSIGDVSGKGIPAALLMAKTISEMRVATFSEKCPADVLAMVNSMMLGSISPEMFVTALECFFDPETRCATVSDAGHNPPLLKHNSGEVELLTLTKGFPLGVIDEGQYCDVDVSLDAGDTLLFYTDGLTDATGESGETFGLERLCATVNNSHAGAKAVVDSLIEAVREFTGLARPFDDVTMVALSPT
ncbi:MAG: SpoIIE family protein phosphatase [Planctomycetota bacterium]|jgi:serine phosphatase RsbU (regulator of sigma subunit)/pSer/pThr/pTyr-binding forkhead associated (FHA) protein